MLDLLFVLKFVELFNFFSFITFFTSFLTFSKCFYEQMRSRGKVSKLFEEKNENNK